MTNQTPQTENQRPVHETADVKFYVVDGEVVARTKDGVNLPSTMLTNLLLLDIAQTLTDIRRYGVAQDSDYGQTTWVKS